MKNISLLLLLCLYFFGKSNAQTITGVQPNQAAVGTTLTATITGQNTFFLTATIQGHLFFKLSPVLSCRYIPASNVQVFSEDSARVDFVIPPDWPSGPVPLIAIINYNQVILDSAVTISGGMSYGFYGISPDTASENSTMHAIITGLNLQALMASPTHRITIWNIHSASPTFATNVNFVDSNTISADFLIKAYCDTGYWTFAIETDIACYYQFNAVYVSGYYPKQLLSINPQQGVAGNTLSAFVTGQNTFFQSASLSGFYSIQLRDEYCHNIIGTNSHFIDDDHFSVNFNVPTGAVNGIYGLYGVLSNGFSYTLSNAVTITGGLNRELTNISPPAMNAGNIIHATITGLSVDSIFSNASLVISNAAGFVLHATNIIVNPTSATLDISVPIYADNGFYSVNVSSNQNCYTLTNAINVSSGVPRGLISMTPDSGKRGQTLSAVITGTYTFFMMSSAPGGVRKVYFNHTGSSSQFVIDTPYVSVIDSEHVSLNFIVPYNTPRGYYNVVVETFNHTMYNLNPGFEVLGARISGEVYFDVDSNGVFNTGDVFLHGRKVLLLPDSIITITGSSGEYDFGVDSGQYSLMYYPDSNWVTTSSPPVVPIPVDSLDTLGILIGLQPVNEQNNLAVDLTSNFPRCFQNVGYFLNYSNLGTTSVNGVIGFLPDSNLSVLIVNPPEDFTSGDTLFWNYDSLVVGGTGHLSVLAQLPGPNTNLQSIAIMNAMDSAGNVLASTIDTLFQVVRCSYDPNDKSAEPEGVDVDHYTLIGNSLDYTIRFQNTGNDTAFQVLVIDTLDNALDPHSLEIVANSHSVDAHIHDQVVEFLFNNIQLPDSNVDESASHGFIKFRVRVKDTTNTGTVVRNTASIHFDLNMPVITNTVFNTLVDLLPDAIPIIASYSEGLSIYPNPSNAAVNIVFDNAESQKRIVSICEINGQEVWRVDTHDRKVEAEARSLSPGIYLVLIKTSDGEVLQRGKVVVLRVEN